MTKSLLTMVCLTITFATGLTTNLGFVSPREALAADDARTLWQFSCMIRKDKFDYVLPGAMRRNNIDMWIVLDRGRGTEPMALDFGVEMVNGQGIYVFYDPGEGRIERIQLGPETDMAEDCGAYDMYGSARQLKSIVEERDPETIGLNYLAVPNTREGIHVANGLSHTDHKYLTELLGEKYASRFVSAQHLIADFHGERVAGEIIEFSKIGEITRKGIERALSNEVITPGVTSKKDVSLWLEEYGAKHGLRRAWYGGMGINRPGGVPNRSVNNIIQRGDILQIDWGGGRNNFSTDMKRFAYVLKEGEEVPPPDVTAAFQVAVDIAEIIRKNVRSGRTGREQLDELKQIISEAGYNYTERERPTDGPGIDVNVGMHAAGNIGHDVAAGLFEIFPERTKYMVRPNDIISLEYRIFMPSDNWGGRKIGVNIEENALITERGIEWLYPPQEKVLIIR